MNNPYRYWRVLVYHVGFDKIIRFEYLGVIALGTLYAWFSIEIWPTLHVSFVKRLLEYWTSEQVLLWLT